jgi:hypothetical protein
MLTDMDSAPDSITIDITDSNQINFPFEWSMNLEFGHRYVQITIVDDRIVIHKPIAADIEYTKPCKTGENSYIRSLGLFSVRIPKQLLQMLGINAGDKADLVLEENCISIRKNPNDEPELPAIEVREPLMAFCCVCGKLLYTENALVKVASKYICHECVELVKAIKEE